MLENTQRIHERIHKLLKNFQGIKQLKELFWVELNYHHADTAIHDLPASTEKLVETPPVCFATAGANQDFHIIYVQLKTPNLSKTDERQIVTHLQTRYTDALYVFSNLTQDQWHLINVKFAREKQENPQQERLKPRNLFRRITIGTNERLRTAAERIAMLDLEKMENPEELFGQEFLTALDIREKHEEAFDVEAVTAAFFEHYKTVFERLRTQLLDQTDNPKWAHDYAQQFLSRCLFLYFIQRKGWLGKDTEFLRTFWETYQASAESPGPFVEKWLNILFFEAFNNRFHGGYTYFPTEIRTTLQLAPYLNGGLFRENELDTEYNPIIADELWEEIFTFFEKYNFTIAEDTPFDQEVAVDPEMIGKVYESLVATEKEEKGDAGIFYTPRVEIDLMCRLALVDNLANHIGTEDDKHLFYETLFAFEPEEKTEADEKLAPLWEAVHRHLTAITVLDPACGSGSFLVGMLHVLEDVQERAERALGLPTSARFERRKSLIGKNLYGVDVKPWACKVAELRLWLALIIDADFPEAELQIRQEPLLPDFSFNIRQGDSIVQNIGRMNLAQTRGISSGISRTLRSKITSHQQEKLRFYNNDPEGKYTEKTDVQTAERTLFRELLENQEQQISKDIRSIRLWLEDPTEQLTFKGIAAEPEQLDLKTLQKQQELEREKENLAQVQRARTALPSDTAQPFVWDIAFVEIFQQRGGFDIVIENPPYIRNEDIRDLQLPREESETKENKKAYKAKLARSIYQTFPKFFGYQPNKDTKPDKPEVAVKYKLDGRSDLYTYFYFHALSLLSPKGTLCSITSKSWLDSEFGTNLKEFLLTQFDLKLIIDNAARRSFKNANINTVISLITHSDKDQEAQLENITRFVNFTVPFEAILDPIIFYEMETASERIRTQEHQVYPLSQRTLLTTGLNEKNEYTSDGWGGKYFRAPDIYWTVLEKGKDLLIPIQKAADVQRGITTGVNEFFILTESTISTWNLEEEFLKPIIADLKASQSLLIQPERLPSYIFMCKKEKDELRGTAALDYINWGETQGFHEKQSCRGRRLWYNIGERPIPHLNFPRRSPSEITRTFYTPEGCYALDKFIDVNVPEDMRVFFAYYLNSTLFHLMVNVNGRSNFGHGTLEVQVSDLKKLLCINPKPLNIYIQGG